MIEDNRVASHSESGVEKALLKPQLIRADPAVSYEFYFDNVECNYQLIRSLPVILLVLVLQV